MKLTSVEKKSCLQIFVLNTSEYQTTFLSRTACIAAKKFILYYNRRKGLSRTISDYKTKKSLPLFWLVLTTQDKLNSVCCWKNVGGMAQLYRSLNKSVAQSPYTPFFSAYFVAKRLRWLRKIWGYYYVAWPLWINETLCHFNVSV